MQDIYRTVAEFAQTWGLMYFVVLFGLAVVYAMRPSRKQEFEAAAHVPLRED